MPKSKKVTLSLFHQYCLVNYSPIDFTLLLHLTKTSSHCDFTKSLPKNLMNSFKARENSKYSVIQISQKPHNGFLFINYHLKSISTIVLLNTPFLL